MVHKSRPLSSLLLPSLSPPEKKTTTWASIQSYPLQFFVFLSKMKAVRRQRRSPEFYKIRKGLKRTLTYLTLRLSVSSRQIRFFSVSFSSRKMPVGLIARALLQQRTNISHTKSAVVSVFLPFHVCVWSMASCSCSLTSSSQRWTNAFLNFFSS